MELREMEGETAAQEGEIVVLEAEVEAHAEAVCWLEEAVSDMEVAQLLLNSPNLERAMEAAVRSLAVTEERVETLRGERDAMCDRNAALEERCQSSIARKQAAQEKLQRLTRPKRMAPSGSNRGAGGPQALPHYDALARDLQDDLDRTLEAVQELRIARSKLDAINL